MKNALILIFLFLISASVLQAQEKGVDQQNERVRDSGNNRTPAINGGNVNSSTGRGMDFGRDRTPTPPPVPNPYRLSMPNDAVAKAVEELMRERKLILDETVSRKAEGVLISQPYTFIRGAVAAQSEINRYAVPPNPNPYALTRGRYTMTIEIQPIDNRTTNVSVNAKVEGRSENELGTQWITLRSSGIAEEEFLIALVEKLTGAPPTGREPSQQ
jgi:hypothetical protein